MHMLIENPLLSRLIDEKQHVILIVFFFRFCYIIVMSKHKRILSFFGWENKREEHVPQMETSRTDNVGEDKLRDTDECEPFVEPKDKAVRRNLQSSWLEIHALLISSA